MYQLQFRAADGSTTFFDEQRVLRVGRGEDNDIVLDSASISRKHAELRPTDTGWDLYDTGSAAGTWVNNQRVAHVPLGATTTVRFGAESDGVEATITVDLPDAAAGDAPDLQATTLLPDQQSTYIPGGDRLSADHPTGLLIRTRDGDKRIEPGKAVRIGRDTRWDIVAADPAVSRHHADVEQRADGWWFVDHSNSGSFIDGERVKEKKITEQTVVQLGHPEAGYQVTLVPVGDVASTQKAIASKRRRRKVMAWGAAAAVVAVVGAGVAATVLLTGRDTEQDTLSAVELDRAKRASVQIVALTADGEPVEKGSGTIISADGLILTNNHVVDPTKMGLAESEDESWMYVVAFAKDDATPAEPRYRATPMVADEYLDLAVLKINANADGSPLEAGKLTLPEPVPIGDSNALRTGDRITALGYPGLTAEPGRVGGPLTVTSGDVASFKPDLATKTERWWIDSTERIGSGNSGGGSINNAGELIGVNTAVITAGTAGEQLGEFTSGSSLVRPVALAADIITIGQKGGDPNHVSPYLAKIPKVPADATVKSAGWETVESEECVSFNDETHPAQLTGVRDGDVVFAKFEVTGIPDGTPVKFVLLADDQKTVIESGQDEWLGGPSTKCMPIEIKIQPRLAYAVLAFGFQAEVGAVNPVVFN